MLQKIWLENNRHFTKKNWFVLNVLTWKIVKTKNQKIKLFKKKFLPVEYWKNSNNAVTTNDNECQGRIAIYRAGPRYVSCLTYRYCIDISPYPLIPTIKPLCFFFENLYFLVTNVFSVSKLILWYPNMSSIDLYRFGNSV